MLLLYRIYAILSSISGIVQFPEYDGLHKYQIFHTFQTSRTFQTTQPPGFFAVVPIFPRQKVDHRRLYSASEKLKAIAPAEEGRIYIYIMYIPPFSHESVQPKNRRTRNQTRIRQATRWGRHWAQYEAPSRLQMRLEVPLTRT